MTFANKLRKYRKGAKLKQSDLAEILNLPRTTISELETGKKKATLKMIEKIAEGTNTNVSDWLDESITDIDVQPFDGFKTLLPALINAGLIDNEGNISTSAMGVLNEMLEKEVKLFVERYNEDKKS